ncbi:MAG: hypothetical protein HOD43_13500 [Candidatus Marinimicrobia bacterium]|jgi:hypothetical protein|nr:hypothetical protein [Candidatus Neomarinimicrobiota bacterium]MBT3629786.1 hypothetical protein [Candidatus Neomarinimicrobiota bacterium]MBT3823748.1 hypothetical protein [Candidatus Neomarinimicrobiota bacterium]MBT4132510.1 hypothetical protein [Candidatus Neomarinimicrobiota bacterium]MBT4296809.1 hypothetical protein [Candidatus Neomarinimicrobiota bacterium]
MSSMGLMVEERVPGYSGGRGSRGLRYNAEFIDLLSKPDVFQIVQGEIQVGVTGADLSLLNDEAGRG